jgi:outer membrane protease
MSLPRRTRACLAFGLVVLSVLVAVPLFADVTWTASTGTGVMYGLVKELVYSQYNGTTYTESELDWDLKPLVYARASLALGTTIGFVASLDARLGIPAKTGQIGDSDWLNVAYNGNQAKTNYSQHDCYTERAIMLDLRTGWDLRAADWVTFEPFLGFGLMDFKWTARDGYLQYPPGWFGGTATLPYPDSSTDAVVPVSGVGIIYQQTYLVCAAGLAAKVAFGRAFSGSVSIEFSPLVLCNDLDNHEFAGKDFYDSMFGGFFLEPRISLDWQMLRNVRLSLNVGYRHIAGLVGTTTVVGTGVGYTPGRVAGTYPGGAGASFDALDGSLDLVWTL